MSLHGHANHMRMHMLHVCPEMRVAFNSTIHAIIMRTCDCHCCISISWLVAIVDSKRAGTGDSKGVQCGFTYSCFFIIWMVSWYAYFPNASKHIIPWFVPVWPVYAAFVRGAGIGEHSFEYIFESSFSDPVTLVTLVLNSHVPTLEEESGQAHWVVFV